MTTCTVCRRPSVPGAALCARCAELRDAVVQAKERGTLREPPPGRAVDTSHWQKRLWNGQRERKI